MPIAPRKEIQANEGEVNEWSNNSDSDPYRELTRNRRERTCCACKYSDGTSCTGRCSQCWRSDYSDIEVEETDDEMIERRFSYRNPSSEEADVRNRFVTSTPKSHDADPWERTCFYYPYPTATVCQGRCLTCPMTEVTDERNRCERSPSRSPTPPRRRSSSSSDQTSLREISPDLSERTCCMCAYPDGTVCQGRCSQCWKYYSDIEETDDETIERRRSYKNPSKSSTEETDERNRFDRSLSRSSTFSRSRPRRAWSRPSSSSSSSSSSSDEEITLKLTIKISGNRMKKAFAKKTRKPFYSRAKESRRE